MHEVTILFCLFVIPPKFNSFFHISIAIISALIWIVKWMLRTAIPISQMGQRYFKLILIHLNKHKHFHSLSCCSLYKNKNNFSNDVQGKVNILETHYIHSLWSIKHKCHVILKNYITWWTLSVCLHNHAMLCNSLLW